MSRLLTQHDIETVMKLLDSNSSVGFIAPTGSGKSTLLATALHNEGAKTFIIQPTNSAVEGLYERQRSQLGNDVVGYAAEMKIRYFNTMLSRIRNFNSRETKPDTSMVYVTSGHIERVFMDLVRFFQSRKRDTEVDLAFCDIIMLDEAHNGSLDNDVIITLWKVLLDAGCNVPIMLLASATLNMELTKLENSPMYKADSDPVFPIRIQYHDTDYILGNKTIYEDIAATIKNLHNIDKGYQTIDTDTWLVFCPGRGEVDSILRLMENVEDMEVVPVYSDMTAQQRALIYKNTGHKRKLVIATNIAESSVTIPNVSGVFDCCLEKINTTSLSGAQKLELAYISKSSAEQRKGRTGRTCPGFCYRFCTEGFFTQLKAEREKEIHRVPIYNVILKFIDLSLDPVELFPEIAESRMREAIILLKDLGMISYKKTMITTDMGRFASHFYLSIRNIAILYNILEVLPVFPCLCVLVLIDTYNPGLFYLGETEDMTRFARYESETDIGVMLNVIVDYLSTTNGEISRHRIVRFSRERSLNNKRFSEIMMGISRNMSTLENLGKKVEIGLFSVANLLDKIRPYIVQHYEIVERHAKVYTIPNTDIQYHTTENQLHQSGFVYSVKLVPLIFRESGNKRKPKRHIVLSM